MSESTDILVIVGSLRAGSYNRMLAQAAAAFAPAGVTFSFADITGVPLFNEDHRSAHGEPPAVQALKDGISEADGVLIVSPEYNLSVPGVLKNAIDWASYGSDHPFKGKPMAVMGTSPGRFGTISMQRHLRDVLGALGAYVLPKPAVTIADARAMFDAQGELVDERSRRQVQALVEALVHWAGIVGAA